MFDKNTINSTIEKLNKGEISPEDFQKQLQAHIGSFHKETNDLKKKLKEELDKKTLNLEKEFEKELNSEKNNNKNYIQQAIKEGLEEIQKQTQTQLLDNQVIDKLKTLGVNEKYANTILNEIKDKNEFLTNQETQDNIKKEHSALFLNEAKPLNVVDTITNGKEETKSNFTFESGGIGEEIV